MKKSQRLRLATLLAQTVRTAAEEQELQTLQALAAANPDASKDEDDTAGNVAGSASDPKPGTLQAFMGKFTAAISEKQRLIADLAAANARILVLEAGQVGTVTLAAVLDALNLKAADLAGKDAAAIAEAINSAVNPDGATHVAQIGTLTTERDAACATISTLATCLGLAASDLSAPSADTLEKFGLKDDDAWKKLTGAQKSERLVQAAYERAISDRTVAQVKELGFNAGALPSPKGSSTDESLEEVQAQLATATDPAERGRLAAKANKLRDAKWASGSN